MKRAVKNQHQPSAERKIGLAALKNYAIGFILASIYIVFVSVPLLKEQAQSIVVLFNLEPKDKITQSLNQTALIQLEYELTTLQKITKKTYKELIDIAYEKYPYIKIKKIEKNPSAIKNVQSSMKNWEKETGKVFLNDHWTMKPNVEVVNAYKNVELVDLYRAVYINITGIIPLYLAKIADKEEMKECKSIKRENEKRKKIIARIDLTHGVNSAEEFDIYLNPEKFLKYEPTYCETGFHDEIITTQSYENKGICWIRHHSIKSSFGTKFESFYRKVNCGNVWRKWVRSVYYASTLQEFTNLDSSYQNNKLMNQHALAVNEKRDKYYHKMINDQKAAETRNKVKIIDKEFAIILMKGAIARENTQAKIYNAQFHQKKELFYKNIKNIDIGAARIALLSGATLVLLLYVIAGNKYSPLVSFLPRNFYLLALPFFIVYAYSFKESIETLGSSLWLAAFVFIPPLSFLTLPTLKLALVEWIKEHPEYRRLFVIGRGGESSRWGGLLEIFDRDITDFFDNSKRKIIKTEYSPLYIGKTTYDQDIRINGRSIGLTTDQHMITVAGSGAGKSRDAITSNLLTYCGGVLAFDPKGEHVRVTYERRKAYASAYVLDPYGEVSDVVKTSYWNPLDEINPEADSARGDLKRIADASIFVEKDEGANSAFFRENAQMILRGFIAHVVTEYPQKMRNLPTVYDIIKTGKPEGGNPSPKAMEALLFEMMTNHAIGDAPRDAATLLKNSSDRESSSYMSTIARGIDWINEPRIREILSQPSDFSIRECKTDDASVYLVLPEKFMEQQSRFLRTFYTVALDIVA